MTARVWRKASQCGNATCVEVAEDDGSWHVRDSKLGDRGPVLEFTPGQWQEFVAAVKAGRFDEQGPA